MDPTDAELLALIREGDRQARETFVQRHTGSVRVYAIACGASDADAKDLVQDLLFAVISRPPTVLKAASAEPYMNLSVRRELGRGNNRPSPETPISHDSSLPDPRTSLSELMARRELLSDVWREIRQLATVERVVFPLRYGLGLTFAEIAGITGRSEKTEWSSHHRALEKVRRKLSGLVLQ
jgi:RNA polymerase sigma factor (sigma-70 family)